MLMTSINMNFTHKKFESLDKFIQNIMSDYKEVNNGTLEIAE